jgi:hypothetical protein
MKPKLKILIIGVTAPNLNLSDKVSRANLGMLTEGAQLPMLPEIWVYVYHLADQDSSSFNISLLARRVAATISSH